VRDEDAGHLLGPRDWPAPCTWCGGRLVHSQTCRELRDGWAIRFGFGKHKGQRVDRVPREYLEWLWSSGSIANADLKAAIAKILGVPDSPRHDMAA